MRNEHRHWDLSHRDEFPAIEEELKTALEIGGLTAGSKIIYGKTDVTVHNDHTATVTIETNGRVFTYTLKLYTNGYWDVLE